jgi:hypothetical protein
VEPFFVGDRRWPPGCSWLQLYVTPDLDRDGDLGVLVDRCGRLLGEYATLAVVPPEWLHITVQPIRQRGVEVSPAERADLIGVLTAALRPVPAFTVLAGSVVAGSVGVLADLHPDGPFEYLLDVAREAIVEACGSDAISYDTRPFHLALAYALGAENGSELQHRLRRIRPGHAELTVDAVRLVEVRQDLRRGRFWWHRLHVFPLTAAADNG